MERREKTVILRLSLVGEITDSGIDDEALDGEGWLDEWETAIKPGLVRAVFAHIRGFPGWEARIRNRGVPASDEVEIVVTRRFDTSDPQA
jgi:hypothetical protein